MEQNGPWAIDFFEDDEGRNPVVRWLDSLSPEARSAVNAGLEHVLTRYGPDVCSTEFGKNLGDGIFELRIRQDAETIARKAGVGTDAKGTKTPRLFRVFFHAYGQRVVLLLNAYDKLADSGARRQNKEIELAKKRLRSFKLSQQREKKRQKRR